MMNEEAQFRGASPIFPIYLLIDVSFSMSSQLEALNRSILGLLETARSDSVLNNLIALSVISFSDDALLEMPLSPVWEITGLPVLRVRGGTRFGPPLQLLDERLTVDRQVLRADGYRQRRPLAFFFTDGAPGDRPDEWIPLAKKLRDRARTNLVALGFGGADPAAIRALASAPDLAFMSSPLMTLEDSLAGFSEMLKNSVRAVSASTLEAKLVATVQPPSAWIEIPDDLHG